MDVQGIYLPYNWPCNHFHQNAMNQWPVYTATFFTPLTKFYYNHIAFLSHRCSLVRLPVVKNHINKWLRLKGIGQGGIQKAWPQRIIAQVFILQGNYNLGAPNPLFGSPLFGNFTWENWRILSRTFLELHLENTVMCTRGAKGAQ